MVSNMNNFLLELPDLQAISLEPHGCLEVPVRFTPSDLGFGDHHCTIVFYSKEVSDSILKRAGKAMQTPRLWLILYFSSFFDFSSKFV